MSRRELVAAASRYTTRRLRSKPVDQGWQERAWAHFDAVPEVRFAATWISNAMGRATLYAARRGDDGTIEPAPAGHRATELVSTIAGGPDGQAQLLEGFGAHLIVAGEGWIVIRPRTGPGGTSGEDWRVLSVQEVKLQSGKMTAEWDGDVIDIPPFDPDGTPDPAAPVALRVWQPHPRRYMEADSPVRTSLTLLEELQLLNAAVAAVARSRLTGRGILLIPKGTRFPATPTQGDAEDDLIDVLMTVAETAYREPESAAATVPIILEVPAETISGIQRLTFESDFDELALKLRDEAIRRFATGLEVPAEVLLGLGGDSQVNHWSAWAIKEEAIQLGVEPRLATVTHALTTQWLQPLLEAEDVEDADRWLVAYDTAPLRVRANRAETAILVHQAGAISDAALRRETGFDEADAPTTGEQTRRTTSDAPANGTDLPVDETTSEPDTLPAAAHPAAAHDGVLAAADGLIWAALAAAGRKLERTPACPRSERARARDTEPARVHTLVTVQPTQVEQWGILDGAWTRVPEIADRYGLNAECLTATLDDYCRELIAAGIPHSYEQTAGALHPCLGIAA